MGKPDELTITRHVIFSLHTHWSDCPKQVISWLFVLQSLNMPLVNKIKNELKLKNVDIKKLIAVHRQQLQQGPGVEGDPKVPLPKKKTPVV